MPKTYDCIVIGVGGFGSGVLDHLAMSGLRVLGIEQFEIAHDQGSSHGDTRIIRKAYFEHPDYVPLLLRAYELWDDLEADHGQKLREECGLLLAGPPNGDTVTGAKLSSKLHGLSLDEMTANEAMQRFPGFSIPDEHTAVYEPEAGFLHVEECVRAHTARSQRNSAELHVGETVLSWQSKNGSIRVKTNQGEYEAGQLVITAGPWADLLLKELAVPLEVVRKPLFWHASEKSDYHLANGCPTFFFERDDGEFYGFPSLDGVELKLAEHTGGQPVIDPFTVNRDVDARDIEPIAKFLTDSMPGIISNPTRHSVCMYTRTPDSHFIVDRHPEYDNVVIGAGFSGHGFKFTSVLGKAMADLAINQQTDLPIEFLSLNRKALQSTNENQSP